LSNNPVFMCCSGRMKKRKLVDNAQHLSRINNNKVGSSNAELAKKRKKFNADNVDTKSDDCNELSNQEKFLLETKAALKSLSGSWPNSNSAEDRYEKPNFENLFEDNSKKYVNIAQVSSTKCKTQTNIIKNSEICPIKDVVTLSSVTNNPTESKKSVDSENEDKEADNAEEESKDHQADDNPQTEKTATEVRKNENVIENLLKIENECEKIPKHDKSKIEIKDIKETKCNKESVEADSTEDKSKPYENYTPGFQDDKSINDEFSNDRYSNYTDKIDKSEYNADFCTEPKSSNETGDKSGPYGVEATFIGGYVDSTKPVEKIAEISRSPVSPGTGKRYTILQPASADSKAASQIQDIAKIGISVILPAKENDGEPSSVKIENRDDNSGPPMSPSDNPSSTRGM
jgi:hypothetical protein